VLSELIHHKLFLSYTVLQFLVFSLVPFLLLGFATLFKPRESISNALTWIAATMLLGQVLLMRWNVVVGGQLVSKSFRGFTSYFPGVFGHEGLVMAAVVFTAPFAILYVFHRIVPLFPGVAKGARGS